MTLDGIRYLNQVADRVNALLLREHERAAVQVLERIAGEQANGLQRACKPTPETKKVSGANVS